MSFFQIATLAFIAILLYDLIRNDGCLSRHGKGNINDDHTDASTEDLTGYKF